MIDMQSSTKYIKNLSKFWVFRCQQNEAPPFLGSKWLPHITKHLQYPFQHSCVLTLCAVLRWRRGSLDIAMRYFIKINYPQNIPLIGWFWTLSVLKCSAANVSVFSVERRVPFLNYKNVILSTTTIMQVQFPFFSNLSETDLCCVCVMWESQKCQNVPEIYE